MHASLRMTAQPPGAPVRGLGFHIEPTPGIPDPETLLAAGLRLCTEGPAFSGMPPEDAEATLAALAETLTRARYHKLRFNDCIETAKARRTVLGGPVVADWHAVPPIICEAIAFLGAARTAVDILIYLAARRAGKSEATADRWDASEAISPKHEPGQTEPTRYDVPEVLAMRKRQLWFDELNLYRNVVYHRGWREQRYGFYMPADTAEEAGDPAFNAMLLPDADSLRQRKRPHEWTYLDKRRLDDLVNGVDKTLFEVFEHILTTLWNCPLPAPGTMPKLEQPNALLFLPCPVVLDATDRRIVPVFDSKPAARAFTLYGPLRDKLILRAIRPTSVGSDKPGFLIPFAPTESPKAHEVHFHSLANGSLTLAAQLPVNPNTDGPVPGVLNIRVLDESISVLYVWQSPRSE
jgi:hypothetical protein